MNNRDRLITAAALLGFTGVLAGTFAAHALKEHLAADLLETFEVGVRYHLVHAIAVLAVAAIAGSLSRPKLAMSAGWFMTVGVIIFSGSLYLLAMTGQRWLGMITPIGGVLFLVGWLCLGLAACLKRRNE